MILVMKYRFITYQKILFTTSSPNERYERVTVFQETNVVQKYSRGFLFYFIEVLIVTNICRIHLLSVFIDCPRDR